MTGPRHFVKQADAVAGRVSSSRCAAKRADRRGPRRPPGGRVRRLHRERQARDDTQRSRATRRARERRRVRRRARSSRARRRLGRRPSPRTAVDRLPLPVARPVRRRSRRRRPPRCGAATPGCGARTRQRASDRREVAVADRAVDRDRARRRRRSRSTRGSRRARGGRRVVSASALKAWRDPSTRSDVEPRTSVLELPRRSRARAAAPPGRSRLPAQFRMSETPCVRGRERLQP